MLNFNGTGTEQAIRIYHDGTEAGRDTGLEGDTQKEEMDGLSSVDDSRNLTISMPPWLWMNSCSSIRP